MRRSIFKPIIFGLLFGAAVFFAPFFILHLLFWMFLIGGILRLAFWGRWRRWGGPQFYVAFADKMRSMSEEEYQAYKQKVHQYEGHCCGHQGWHYCHENKKDTNSKSE